MRFRSAVGRSARLLELVVAVCLFGCRGTQVSTDPVCTGDAATALYARKIEPILKDDRPTSCNQCHLSGIDLSLFVRDTPCQTMACMQTLGLVDLDDPESSKVLGWIERAKPQSTLITEDVIQAEYRGVLEWIEYSASCGAQVCPSYEDPCNQNVPPSASRCEVDRAVGADYNDPGDCQELTLERLFASNVYQWRERCYPCHFKSDASTVQAPKWITDVTHPTGSRDVTCATGSLETMRTILSWGLVDLTTPSQSLLLLKPLALAGGRVPHGGGAKFDGLEDPTYQSFLTWITRYSACAAQDATLPKAAPAPPAVPPDQEDAGIATSGGTSSIYDYCNCMLFNCHDASHAKWGESDEQLLAGCRADALDLPWFGAPTMSGHFLECRAAFCAQGRDNPDACSAALGETVCR